MDKIRSYHGIPVRLSARDAGDLSELISGLSGCAPVDPPLGAPALLLGAEGMTPIVELMVPPAGMAVVHEAQVLQRRAGMSGTGLYRIDVDISEKASGRVFDFRLMDAGAVVGEMQTRLRFVTPDVMRALKGSVFPPHQDRPEMIWRTTAPFSPEAVRTYVGLAHDTNPIHVNDTAARAVGLSGAVVPGMLLASCVESVVSVALKGCRIREMRMRFLAAVPVGQAIRYGVLARKADSEGTVRLVRVFLVTSGNVIAGIADLETGGG